MELVQKCPHCGICTMVEDYDLPTVPRRLLSANDAPYPAEDVVLRQTLDDMEQAMVSLDATTRHLVYLLKSVKEQNLCIKADARVVRGMLSAVRRVPTEVWGEIIRMALHGQDVYVANAVAESSTRRPSRDLWSYTQVSRSWRAAVLSLSTLWSKIRVQYLDRDDGTENRAPEMLRTVLSRAQLQPLTINLDISSSSLTARQLLQEVISQSKLWKNVKLRIPPSLLKNLRPVKDCLPLLEKLELYHYANMSRFPVQAILSCFQNAPSLRHVALGSFIQIESLKIPWAQITHFEDNYFGDGEDILQVLRQLPNLSSYTLRWDGRPKNFEVVTLAHLRTLTVEESVLLPYLRLPSLEQLTASVLTPLENVRTMIQASECALKELSLIYHGRLSAGEIISLFQLLPSLTSLRVRGTLPTEFFSILNEPGILPNLQVLQLDFGEPAILELVQLRVGVGALKKLHFTGRIAPSKTLLDNLGVFKEQGLEVTTG